MKNVILIGKVATLATWAVLASNMFIPEFWANINAEIGLYLNIGFIGLVLVHNFEALMFMNSNRNSNEPILLDGLQVFAFGIFHTIALKQDDTAQSSYSQAA
jgi:uncharacterized protein YhhL (DUF1145 family)